MFSLLVGWLARDHGTTRTGVVVNFYPSKETGCVCQAHLRSAGIDHKAGVYVEFIPSFTYQLRRPELNQVIYAAAKRANKTLNLMKKVKRLAKEHGRP